MVFDNFKKIVVFLKEFKTGLLEIFHWVTGRIIVFSIYIYRQPLFLTYCRLFDCQNETDLQHCGDGWFGDGQFGNVHLVDAIWHAIAFHSRHIVCHDRIMFGRYKTFEKLWKHRKKLKYVIFSILLWCHNIILLLFFSDRHNKSSTLHGRNESFSMAEKSYNDTLFVSFKTKYLYAKYRFGIYCFYVTFF